MSDRGHEITPSSSNQVEEEETSNDRPALVSLFYLVESLLENELYQATLQQSMDTYNQELFRKRTGIQLQNIEPFVLHEEELQKLEGEKKCFICLEPLEISQNVLWLPCKHMFHQQCVQDLISHQHAKCPLCRNDIPLIEKQEVTGTETRTGEEKQELVVENYDTAEGHHVIFFH